MSLLFCFLIGGAAIVWMYVVDAYRKQNDEILKLHTESLIERGIAFTNYRCRACKFPFSTRPAFIVECPNCRGLVKIRLPRG